MRPEYSIVIPAYNEEDVLCETYKRLTAALASLENYELIFVNDGSRDQTAQIIYGFVKSDARVRLLNFSRNFGHQAAITAGIDYSRGDAVIIIDADLQDPPEVIPEMAHLWKQGYEVVYGKRKKRRGETAFKKASAKAYYRFLNKMTNVDIPVDTGDFRLLDRKVCNALKSLREKTRYVRGLVSWVGYKQIAVEYVRDERYAGETKYPLSKMIKFAMDGITAFSYRPLKLATSLGFLLSVGSFIYLLVIVFQRLFTNSTITGWASTIAVILLSQGIILMILGLMGEYIGRIYEEIKDRPLYIVSESLGFPPDCE